MHRAIVAVAIEPVVQAFETEALPSIPIGGFQDNQLGSRHAYSLVEHRFRLDIVMQSQRNEGGSERSVAKWQPGATGFPPLVSSHKGGGKRAERCCGVMHYDSLFKASRSARASLVSLIAQSAGLLGAFSSKTFRSSRWASVMRPSLMRVLANPTRMAVNWGSYSNPLRNISSAFFKSPPKSPGTS